MKINNGKSLTLCKYLLIFFILIFASNVYAYKVGAPGTVTPLKAYFIDPSVSDQGVATSQGNRSIKDYVDNVGSSEKATLYFPHTGAASTTTYTLTTSETITANFNLYFENGAILDGAGTLTHSGSAANIIAQATQNIFGSSITVVFTNNGEAYVDWWGTDQDAFDAAIAATRNVRLASGGSYTITSLTQITNANQEIIGSGGKVSAATITYTATSGQIIDIAANYAKLANFYLVGPGTGGSEIALRIGSSGNNKQGSRISGLYIYNTAAGIQDWSFDNFYDDIQIYQSVAPFAHSGGADFHLRRGYISNLTKIATYLLELAAGSNATISETTFARGADYAVGITSTVNSVDFIGCHFEQTGSGGNAATSDIYVTSTTPTINVIGCRLGHDNLLGPIIDTAASGGVSNNVNIIGSDVLGGDIAGGGQGLIQTNSGGIINVIGLSPETTITERDFVTGTAAKGKVYWDAKKVLASAVSNVATDGTGEDNLQTVTIGRNAHRVFDAIDIVGAGTKVGANGEKTLKLYVDAQSVTFHDTTIDQNEDPWRVEATLTFYDNNTSYLTWVGYDGDTMLQGILAVTADFGAGDIVIKVTGECSHANDVINNPEWLITTR